MIPNEVVDREAFIYKRCVRSNQKTRALSEEVEVLDFDLSRGKYIGNFDASHVAECGEDVGRLREELKYT